MDEAIALLPLATTSNGLEGYNNGDCSNLATYVHMYTQTFY